MHEEPIHHLYTNKKLKLSVHTNNGLRFVCSVPYDSSIRNLQHIILQRYNEFVADPTHRYYKYGPLARGVYNITAKSYHLSPSECAIDVLNDFDEVECDINEINPAGEAQRASKKDLKRAKALAHEIPQSVQSPSDGNTFTESGQLKRRRRNRKRLGEQQGTGRELGSSMNLIESPVYPPLAFNGPTTSLSSKSRVEAAGRKDQPQVRDKNEVPKKPERPSDTPDSSKLHNSRILGAEVPEFSLHSQQLPKPQHKLSEQRSEKSLNSPQCRPVNRPSIQSSISINREDSSHRLESDRSEEIPFRVPKVKASSSIKTPEIEPMKSPQIKPMPVLSRMEEKPKTPDSKMSLSNSAPAKKSEDVCIVIAEEEDDQYRKAPPAVQPRHNKQADLPKPSPQPSPNKLVTKSAIQSSTNKKLEKYLTKQFADLAKSEQLDDDD